MEKINMDEVNKISSGFNLENMNSNNGSNLSTTLKQGIQFKKYQDKITTNKKTEEIAFDLEKSDASGITGFNTLSDEPSKIVEGFANTDSSSSYSSRSSPSSSIKSQVDELKALEMTYYKLIQELKVEQEKSLNSTNSYVNQSNSNTNPYLNKNITTKNDGKTYYITGEGVAKLYGKESDYKNIIGKNNCPEKTEEIDSMPSYINMKDGTNMIVGQQCGNEGKNVFVDKMISDTNSTFIGCYNDSFTSRAMKNIGNGLQNYDLESCKQAAIDTGNLYFGLQNLNPTTKKSACYVSNDYAKTTQYKKATPDTIPCQLDNTDNYIYGGTLVNAIYKTPDATYLGLFPKNKEINPPAMTPLNSGTATFTYETCKLAAKAVKNKYFGLQNFNTTTQKCSCLVGNDISQINMNIDASSTSYITGTTNGKKYGNGSNIAIYQVDSEKSYYNGCYNDNETSPAMTAVGNGSSIYSYNTCQAEAIKSGKNYFALQGGKKGTSKCLVSDDLNDAQKYGEYKACVVNSADQNKYGVNGINAVYKMNSVGNPLYMGKMGYVDGNSKLLEYPNNMITHGTNYSKYIGYDSNSRTLKTMTNTTYTACVDECNKNKKYYGFVLNNSTKIGYLKGRDILNPFLKKPNAETDIYIRDFTIKNADESCDRKIVKIHSNQWLRYNKGSQKMSPITTCSLTQQLENTNSKITNLQNQISVVGEKIIYILNNLQKQNEDIRDNIGENSDKIDTDLESYNKVIMDIKKYNKGETNMNNIVKDTNLLVLYNNYNYMFWSILAISTIIISMKMVGK